MAENFIINGSASALAAQGETTAAFSAAESTGAPTDAELRAIADTNGFAVMQTGPTSAEKVAIILTLLDSLASGIDLNTAAKRKAFRLKRGVAEYEDLIRLVP